MLCMSLGFGFLSQYGYYAQRCQTTQHHDWSWAQKGNRSTLLNTHIRNNNTDFFLMKVCWKQLSKTKYKIMLHSSRKGTFVCWRFKVSLSHWRLQHVFLSYRLSLYRQTNRLMSMLSCFSCVSLTGDWLNSITQDRSTTSESPLATLKDQNYW